MYYNDTKSKFIFSECFFKITLLFQDHSPSSFTLSDICTTVLCNYLGREGGRGKVRKMCACACTSMCGCMYGYVFLLQSIDTMCVFKYVYTSAHIRSCVCNIYQISEILASLNVWSS